MKRSRIVWLSEQTYADTDAMWWQKRRIGMWVWCFIYRAQFAPKLFETSFLFFIFALAKRFKGIHRCVQRHYVYCKYNRAKQKECDYDKFIQLSVIHSFYNADVSILLCANICFFVHRVISLQFRLIMYKSETESVVYNDQKLQTDRSSMISNGMEWIFFL